MTAVHPVFRAGATALITGGASGVGLAVAKLCASHNMNLHLIDVDSSKLSSAKDLLSSQSSKSSIAVHNLDVSQPSAWGNLTSQLKKDNVTLDFLHLNAGIGAKGSWGDSDYFHKIFDTNFYGVVNGLNAFISEFDSNTSTEKDKAKAIVITGSKQGITNPPGNAAYNASKAAVKSLAEHLSFDLGKSAPGTSVHLLVPGWTFTGLTGGGNTKEKPDGAWAPEQVADLLNKKMADGKFYIICPDNDVDWETDRKRMLYGVGDIVYERPALSRWREETKDEAKKGVDAIKL